MIRRLLAMGLAALLTLLVTMALHYTINRDPKILTGADTFVDAFYCPNIPTSCTEDDFSPVTLPHFADPPIRGDKHHATYKIPVENKIAADHIPALLAPIFSDGIIVWVNNTRISPDRVTTGPMNHNWNRPLYTPFDASVLKPADNTVTIHLAALPPRPIHLHPIHLGPAKTLEFQGQMIQVARLTYVRGLTGVIIFSIFPMLLLWSMHRQDRMFRWVTLTLLASLVAVLNLSFPNADLFFENWRVIWNIALSLQIYFIYRYIRDRFWPNSFFPLDNFVTLGLAFSIILFLVFGRSQYLYAVLGLHMVSIFMVLIGLSEFILNWRASDRVTRLHLLVLVWIAGIGLSDLIYYYVDAEWVFRPLSGLAYFVLGVGIFAILFNRLGQTIRQYEGLTNSMQSTIEQRTAELEAAQQKVLEIQRQQVIADERQRIMMDLHDGVGGQLVNMLAYMEQANQSDTVLRTSLEDALRDMALVIDSLDGSDDLGTVLASLRDRLEPVLDGHSIRLHWDTENCPSLLGDDASRCLGVARIIQEAITNALKHARAENIQLVSDNTSITVSDDGCGFDVETVTATKRGIHSGIGLIGIRKRAAALGLKVHIHSDTGGTQIVIQF